jgi:hypothetical protein
VRAILFGDEVGVGEYVRPVVGGRDSPLERHAREQTAQVVDLHLYYIQFNLSE